ncbi:hypothetical protein LCGC14_1626290, partial [marine sediment metagenome]
IKCTCCDREMSASNFALHAMVKRGRPYLDIKYGRRSLASFFTDADQTAVVPPPLLLLAPGSMDSGSSISSSNDADAESDGAITALDSDGENDAENDEEKEKDDDDDDETMCAKNLGKMVAEVVKCLASLKSVLEAIQEREREFRDLRRQLHSWKEYHASYPQAN